MCGIVGVTGHTEASNLVYLGLYSLQHRGQESAGIVSTDGEKLFKIKRRELVSDAFNKDSFKFLKGNMAIGHVRYSTTGQNAQKNIHPLVATGSFGNIAIAHNGNLTNFLDIRKVLEAEGALFQSTVDTEVILHLMAKAKDSFEKNIVDSLEKIDGAFSLLFLSSDAMVAVRDPWGFRPLSLGVLENGAKVVASETCAFDLIGASFVRDLAPGEVLIIDRKNQERSLFLERKEKSSKCIFEHIYFARPDSTVYEKSVYQSRKALGAQLAVEHPIEADCVTPVPDSGVISAMGYAAAMKIPMEMGFIRNHYVGRTFIEPNQTIRGFGVKVKLNPVKEVLKNKKIVVVDDSIVRGTTSQKIIKMLRDAGAGHISLLITSPPFVSPCLYGIDTPNKSDLLAANMSLEEMRKFIGADYLGFLSIEGMHHAMSMESKDYCNACFTGQYPTKVPA